MKDRKIAIVGGTGEFGQHLGRRLQDENQINISGSSVENAEKVAEEYGWDYGRNKEVVRGADIVIVSVPIHVTIDVIEEIGPEVERDALFCDVTSVKRKPIEAMKKYSDEVLGMHPMYAPSNSIKGQKIALCPVKGEKWKLMEEFWRDYEAHINFTDPETHDKAMSIVQGLIHYSELVIGDVMRKSGLSEEDLEPFSTPIFQLLTDLTARMFNQKPELYGSIQSENPESENVRKMFAESAEELQDVIGDKQKFAEKFEELGKEFDLEKSQQRSDKVIEYLSNDLRH
jgi:prephenate dehydrogenase